MILCESVSSVSGPKFMVPRQSRLTLRPVRPNRVYSMARDYASDAVERSMGGARVVTFDELGQLAALVQLGHDVTPSDELAVHVKLRNGGPGRKFLDALAHLGIGQ